MQCVHFGNGIPAGFLGTLEYKLRNVVPGVFPNTFDPAGRCSVCIFGNGIPAGFFVHPGI